MGFTSLAGTLLGPLTTAWSMPDSCTVHVLNCPTCTEGFRGQQCVVRDGTGAPEDHTSCWPPATKKAGTPEHPFVGWGFYSPGLACPTGYTAACTAEYGKRPEWEIEFTLIPGETAIGCCPTGFSCTNINGNTCTAKDTQQAVPTAVCSGSVLVNSGLVTLSSGIPATTTLTEATLANGSPGTAVQTTTHQMRLVAPMFQLNFQSSDLISTTTSSSNSITSSASLPSGQSSAGSSSPSDNPSSSSSGLSTGAIAGIGVGAALGGLLLGTLAVLFFLRQRRRKAEGAPPSAAAYEVDGSGDRPAEAPGSAHRLGEYKYSGVPAEMGMGGAFSEMPAGAGQGEYVEMYAGGYQQQQQQQQQQQYQGAVELPGGGGWPAQGGRNAG